MSQGETNKDRRGSTDDGCIVVVVDSMTEQRSSNMHNEVFLPTYEVVNNYVVLRQKKW